MLSPQNRAIVAATAPVIADRLDVIAPDFYRRMFAAHPELLDGMFSRSNQVSGEQPKALAASIVGFATSLLDADGGPSALVERIAHKHTALGVAPEMYSIVYEHLFDAIAADLGAAATADVVAAWHEVYWLFADLLVARERSLYGAQANTELWMPWRVTEKTARSAQVAEFALEPADDTPVTRARAGQFVSVRVRLPDGIRQARQYTLLAPGTGRRFAARLDPSGEVTPVLHETVSVGDVVELSNPYGAVTLDDTTDPMVLVSAGIGCTPTLSYLEALTETGSAREVVVLHADRSRSHWAFRERISALVDRLPRARMMTWFDDENGFGAARLSEAVLPRGAVVRLCGPLPFMKAVRDQATALGIPAGRVHYEVFGPDVWLAG